MMKPKLRQVLVVEGRYDKNTLAQVIDAVILQTNGFGVFHDQELWKLLQFYAETRGVIIMTDSDNAGMMIRNRLKNGLPEKRVQHAYIPEIAGKEKRKKAPSSAGTLGVEGMSPEILLEALRRAGAIFEEESAGSADPGVRVSRVDLYEWGLSGSADSSDMRKRLAAALGFPTNLSAGALLQALNTLLETGSIMPEELKTLVKKIEKSE